MLVFLLFLLFFFFSSRRRHTRFDCDWSSDVCSSDLKVNAGVIGVCSAFYLVRRGFRVTVVDRGTPADQGCSFGNAGMVVPSHFVPLAAPGMVARGLKWMWNPESPFWVKPRLDRELWDWGLKFYRSANARKVAQAAPLLRDLQLASRAAFEELSQAGDFGLVKKG